MAFALSTVEKTPGFLAAFAMDSAELSGGCADRALSTKALWEHLGGLPASHMMVARKGGLVSVASRQGGVFVEGGAGLNIGLLRLALRKHDAVDAGAVVRSECEPELRFDDTAAGVLWDLVQRLARIEASRVIELTTGMTEFTLAVHRDSFEIAGEGGLPALCAAIHQASALGTEVEITYARDMSDEPRKAYTLMDMFRVGGVSEAAGTWMFNAHGWPVTCPPDAQFEQMPAMIGCAQAIRAWAGGANDMSIDMFTPNNTQAFRAVLTDDAQMSLRFSTD